MLTLKRGEIEGAGHAIRKDVQALARLKVPDAEVSMWEQLALSHSPQGFKGESRVDEAAARFGCLVPDV